jgi:hypothetical protein
MIGTRSANYHQGQRSYAPRKQAGHMSALNHLAETSKNLLHRRGRPHMGTIPSLCPYDAAARDALQSANLRRPAILRYAAGAAVFPISQGGLVTPR